VYQDTFLVANFYFVAPQQGYKASHLPRVGEHLRKPFVWVGSLYVPFGSQPFVPESDVALTIFAQNTTNSPQIPCKLVIKDVKGHIDSGFYFCATGFSRQRAYQ
jgi:hypothetical protein